MLKKFRAAALIFASAISLTSCASKIDNTDAYKIAANYDADAIKEKYSDGTYKVTGKVSEADGTVFQSIAQIIWKGLGIEEDFEVGKSVSVTEDSSNLIYITEASAKAMDSSGYQEFHWYKKGNALGYTAVSTTGSGSSQVTTKSEVWYTSEGLLDTSKVEANAQDGENKLSLSFTEKYTWNKK
ncbi:MAG TPA: hypothetical protein DEA32_00025 [Firmicutes bacterium]|nr:hypothetical protein [Bacillota bacterium]